MCRVGVGVGVGVDVKPYVLYHTVPYTIAQLRSVLGRSFQNLQDHLACKKSCS